MYYLKETSLLSMHKFGKGMTRPCPHINDHTGMARRRVGLNDQQLKSGLRGAFYLS